MDLGLPSGTLWAKCNVGALSEIDIGLYFSWGNTDGYTAESGHEFGTRHDYVPNLQLWVGPYSGTPGSTLDQDIVAGGSNDAASIVMGHSFRMPTKEQLEELVNPQNCSSIEVSDYKGSGIAGMLFKSLLNGHTVFFPYGGYIEGSTRHSFGEDANYWSTKIQDKGYSFCLTLHGGVSSVATNYRCMGYNIRAVK